MREPPSLPSRAAARPLPEPPSGGLPFKAMDVTAALPGRFLYPGTISPSRSLTPLWAGLEMGLRS